MTRAIERSDPSREQSQCARGQSPLFPPIQSTHYINHAADSISRKTHTRSVAGRVINIGAPYSGRHFSASAGCAQQFVNAA